MTPLLLALKDLLLGPKTPNWLKMVISLAVIAAIYFGPGLAADRVSNVQRETSNQQVAALNRAVTVMREDIESVREEAVEFAARDSVRARRLEKFIRRVDMKVDEINEHGTDGGNAKIEELERLIRSRGVNPNRGGKR